MSNEYSVDDAGAVEAAESYVLPWGKYKGYRIEDIPNDYLSWLATCDNNTVASFADLVKRYREKWGIEK